MKNSSIKMVGLKPFAKELARIHRATGNLGPAYKAAAILYRQWIGKNFIAEGRLHDNPSLYWKRLKRSTVKRRRKKGRGAKVLRDTGRLSRDWELSSSKSGARVRSGVFYSSVHEDGTRNAGRNRNVVIPQRKIFPEDKQAQKIIAPAFNQHLFKSKEKI